MYNICIIHIKTCKIHVQYIYNTYQPEGADEVHVDTVATPPDTGQSVPSPPGIASSSS